MRELIRAVFLMGAVAGVGVGFAQVSVEGPDAGSVQTQPSAGDGGKSGVGRGSSGGAATQPTAEGVLENLLKQKGNEGTAGAGGPAGIAPEMENGLLREGELVAGRSGQLKREVESATALATQAGGTATEPAMFPDSVAGPRMIFVFDHKEGEPDFPAMEVVPSRRLAVMEDASERGTRPVTFRISAEVTQYRGKNYLYVKPTAGGVPANAGTASSSPPTAATASAPATASGPAASAPVLSPQVDAVAPDEPVAMRKREADTVEGRLGRLVRDAKTGMEVIAFDADGREMRDPPMGVIPCKSLQVMEDATDGGIKPVKFRLSGEVTQYRGKNYLYVRAFQVVKDLGQGVGG